MKKISYVLFVLFTFCVCIYSDEKTVDFPIQKTDEKITIDGLLTETIWQRVEKITSFRQFKPEFGKSASFKTRISVIYNREMIYFAFVCDDPETNKIRATNSKDGPLAGEDSVVILLDTFNDKRNAYLIGTSPKGARFDLKIIEGGKAWEINWDGNWKSAGKINKKNWVVEIGIPFSGIAFDKNLKKIGFNVIRNIPRNEEEALLAVDKSGLFTLKNLIQIGDFDFSKVDLSNYETNLAKHKNGIKKIVGNYLKSDRYKVEKDIFYKKNNNLSEYEKERCFLDLYLPKDHKNFPVMVWFYGGSLEHGNRTDAYTQDMAKHFAHRGLGVAVVDYRLSPYSKYPAYIEDAAASTSWVIKNIRRYRGNDKAVFIGGHSAGGYLTYMLGMDRSYLKAVNVAIDDIAGLIPISGQTFTHYTVREERGIPNPEVTPVIDKAGPAYHAKSSGPPILAICGDKDPGDRKEENQYFMALLKKLGYPDHKYIEAKNRTHFQLISKIPTKDDPVTKAILEFVKRISGEMQ